MPAILFGSISTLTDTSEMQRAAFNVSFTEHGLDWLWEREPYQQLLVTNGGEQRIADYARERGEEVDAAAVHRSKTEHFREMVRAVRTRPRPGVVATIAAAKERGWKVALVTTTSAGNVDAVLHSVSADLDRGVFDLVVDGDAVAAGKPAPDVYEYALRELGVTADDCVAVEDNVGGVAAAQAAGIPCVAFPNANTAAHDFGAAPRTAHLDLDELAGLVVRAGA